MKKLIGLLFTVLCAFSLNAGLILGYSFNEGTGTKANDLSGNANNATINSATWSVGKYGQGLDFNGAGAYLLVTNSPTLNIGGTALTLSLWVYPRALAGGDCVVIGKFWNSAAMDYPWYQYGLELYGGNMPNFFIGNTGVLYNTYNSTIPFDVWTHITCTFDGSTLKTYLNGALDSSQPFNGSMTQRSSKMHIGADTGPGQFFNGKMDEIRVYNTVRTSSEIIQDMNNPIGPPDTNAPTVPNNLVGVGISTNQVSLTWSPATDNISVELYEIQRNGTTIGSTASTNYIDSGLSASNTYTYRVRARDGSGNYSAWTATVNATTQSPPPTYNVVFAWDYYPDLATNIAYFNLRYGSASRTYSSTIQVPITPCVYCAVCPTNQAYSCTNTPIRIPSGTYVAVTAVNVAGLESDYSNEVYYTNSVMVLKPVPPTIIKVF